MMIVLRRKSVVPATVQASLRKMGADLRTARLRRNMSLEEMAERVGVERHAIMALEKGKPSRSLATFASVLWIYGLLENLEEVVSPRVDHRGTALSIAGGRKRARPPVALDNDF